MRAVDRNRFSLGDAPAPRAPRTTGHVPVAGESLVPLLAYCFPNWRTFTALCGASVILALFLAPWMPESPRWLLSQVQLPVHLLCLRSSAVLVLRNGVSPGSSACASPLAQRLWEPHAESDQKGQQSVAQRSDTLLYLQGRTRDATAVLREMADGNGTAMPRRPLLASAAPAGPQATPMDALRVPELRRRMLVMMTCWAVVSLAYYGVSLGLDDLGGSLYVKFFLAALIEFPAYLSVMAVRGSRLRLRSC
jgi:hypothetical protein